MQLRALFYKFRVWLSRKIMPSAPYVDSSSDSSIQEFVGSYDAFLEKNTVGNNVDEQYIPSRNRCGSGGNNGMKRFFEGCLRFVSHFFKVTWKWFLGIVLIAILGVGVYFLVEFITCEYIPEKRLDKAIDELEVRWENSDDDERIVFAYEVLKKRPILHCGNVDSIKLGRAYSTDIRKKEAFSYIENLAYCGNAKGQFALGQLYYWGDELFEIEKDYNKAAYWYNRAVENNYKKAYNNLAMAYKEGRGVGVDMYKVIELLEKGADLNEPYALCNLGDLYRDGVSVACGSHKETYRTLGGPKSPRDEYVKKYIDIYQDEIYYYYRTTVTDYKEILHPNIGKAQELWERAAEQGHEPAKERLQKIY